MKTRGTENRISKHKQTLERGVATWAKRIAFFNRMRFSIARVFTIADGNMPKSSFPDPEFRIIACHCQTTLSSLSAIICDGQTITSVAGHTGSWFNALCLSPENCSFGKTNQFSTKLHKTVL
jgi:hypothetical protein